MKVPGTDSELADELGRLISKEVWTCDELTRVEQLTDLACGRLRQIEEEWGWKPFDDAPKDGTWIEAIGPLDSGAPLHVRWSAELQAWLTQGCGVRPSSVFAYFRKIGPLPKVSD